MSEGATGLDHFMVKAELQAAERQQSNNTTIKIETIKRQVWIESQIQWHEQWIRQKISSPGEKWFKMKSNTSIVYTNGR